MDLILKYKQYLLILLALGAAFLLRNQFSDTNERETTNSPAKSMEEPEQKPSDEASDILTVAEVNPRFPGCENLSTTEEKKKCSDEKLLKYLYEQIIYPIYAQDHGIEGRCVVSFVVEMDGSISNAKIIKDIGGGCGEASLQVVHSMNNMPEKWIAGMDKGRPARVRFNLPVSFRLEEKPEITQ